MTGVQTCALPISFSRIIHVVEGYAGHWIVPDLSLNLFPVYKSRKNMHFDTELSELNG